MGTGEAWEQGEEAREQEEATREQEEATREQGAAAQAACRGKQDLGPGFAVACMHYCTHYFECSVTWYSRVATTRHDHVQFNTFNTPPHSPPFTPLPRLLISPLRHYVLRLV